MIYCGCIRCVPAQSTATIKLELLPLTDGIITLDTLHIDVKEKGIHLLFFFLFVLANVLLEVFSPCNLQHGSFDFNNYCCIHVER